MVRETHFIVLFYCMAKGPLLVACKWATQKQNKDIKKDFELITQTKSLCLKTTPFKMLKMLGMCNMAIAHLNLPFAQTKVISLSNTLLSDYSSDRCDQYIII